MIFDITGKPAFLLRYKIQPEKNVPVSFLDTVFFTTKQFAF